MASRTCGACHGPYWDAHLSGLCDECRYHYKNTSLGIKDMKMDKVTCEKCKNGFWAFEGDTECYDCRNNTGNRIPYFNENNKVVIVEKPKIILSSTTSEIRLSLEKWTYNEKAEEETVSEEKTQSQE